MADITLKSGFEKAISKYFEEYGGKVYEATREVVEEVAAEATDELKAASPRRKGKSKHKYSKGWKYEIDDGRLKTGAVIFGRKGTYNLAHLLEYGHATRNGGRTAPQEHIKPVEERAILQFEAKLKAKLEGVQ